MTDMENADEKVLGFEPSAPTKALTDFVRISEHIYAASQQTYRAALNDGMSVETAEVLAAECAVGLWSGLKASIHKKG